ncbi:sulfatase family protein [Clostridium sp. DL1XJH146]
MGEYLGDHGRIQKGMPGHDCITNVPFIIKYPIRIKGGSVFDELVEGVDIVPTILDYCGVQIPNIVQGRSIKELLDGREYKGREEVLTEFFEPNNLYRASTVRTKEFKYYIDNNGDEILYNLIEDPNELINIIYYDKYKDILSNMRRRLVLRLFQASDNSKIKTAQY